VAAVGQQWESLQWASDEAKGDPVVVLAACGANGAALQ
jgi:hypothetical protein